MEVAFLFSLSSPFLCFLLLPNPPFMFIVGLYYVCFCSPFLVVSFPPVTFFPTHYTLPSQRKSYPRIVKFFRVTFPLFLFLFPLCSSPFSDPRADECLVQHSPPQFILFQHSPCAMIALFPFQSFLLMFPCLLHTFQPPFIFFPLPSQLEQRLQSLDLAPSRHPPPLIPPSEREPQSKFFF